MTTILGEEAACRVPGALWTPDGLALLRFDHCACAAAPYSLWPIGVGKSSAHHRIIEESLKL